MVLKLLTLHSSPLLAALQIFTGHSTEGFALDWSRVVPGRLVSGDCAGKIHLWEPQEGGRHAISILRRASTHSIAANSPFCQVLTYLHLAAGGLCRPQPLRGTSLLWRTFSGARARLACSPLVASMARASAARVSM